MTNETKPAFPIVGQQQDILEIGMTKREYAAIQHAQAMLNGE